MQLDPIKPAAKATGTKRLKLRYYEVLSSAAFIFNWRRCALAWNLPHTCIFQSDIVVGWCRLVDPNKPTLKAPGSRRLKLEDEKKLSNFAFKFNLRRYTVGFTALTQRIAPGQLVAMLHGTGSHSSTFRLNLSAFFRIGVHSGIV